MEFVPAHTNVLSFKSLIHMQFSSSTPSIDGELRGEHENTTVREQGTECKD